MDYDFLKSLTDPVECELLDPEDICEYCVFADSIDCFLYEVRRL